MQNILKNITIYSVIAAGYVLFAFGGYLVGEHKTRTTTDEIITSLEDYVADEAVTLSLREIEVFYLAQALVGEAKGEPDEWETMTTAIFNRVDDDRWPDTLVGTLLQKDRNGRCQIVAMCDAVPEDLTSEIGQAAVAHAQVALEQLAIGTYDRAHNAHSWATPIAADGHAYFGGLCQVAAGSGHQYFADCPAGMVVTSPRPVARPTSGVIQALHIALSD